MSPIINSTEESAIIQARKDIYFSIFGGLLCLVIYSLCLSQVPHALEQLIALPKTTPQENIPWNSISRDVLDGLAAWIGIMMGFILALIFWKYSQQASITMAWFQMCWLGPKAFTVVYIIGRSKNIFNPEQAISPWANSADYFNDPAREYLMALSFVLMFTIVICGNRYIHRQKLQSNH